MEANPGLDDDICFGNSLTHGSVSCVGSEPETRQPNDEHLESSLVLDYAVGG